MTTRLRSLIPLFGALAALPGHAADRTIVLSPVVQSNWAFETHTTGARLRPGLNVGFWQRASGAKPGVGADFVPVLEYQLPEAAPERVRSATFQFSGRQSQCAGAEPMVIDVFGYAADGRADVADAGAGSRLAQLSADCADNPAFARPIDVTALVRKLSVPAGVRHVGFNLRKANQRQGPGFFFVMPGKLTVVLADGPVAQKPASRPAGADSAVAAATPALAAVPAAAAAARPTRPVAQVPRAPAIDTRAKTAPAPAKPQHGAARPGQKAQ